MTPVRRKMTQQTSADFHKNPPTPCSKAPDVWSEMKIYLFQCIEIHLKTLKLGISDSESMPSGCKTAEQRNLCQNNKQIKVKCDQKFTQVYWTNPLILGKTAIGNSPL